MPVTTHTATERLECRKWAGERGRPAGESHRRTGWGLSRLAIGGLQFALLLVLPAAAWAQPIPFPRQADEPAETVPDTVFRAPDRKLVQRLDLARQAIESRQYFDAVKALDAVLQGGEQHDDYFFKPDPAQQVFRSLKSEARRLLNRLPPEGQAEYERQFGSDAKRLYGEALAKGDIGLLEQVAARYFLTPAGVEATWLLARHHADHGRPLAAALSLERLLARPTTAAPFEPTLSVTTALNYQRAGMADQARDALVALKQRSPAAKVRLGEQTVELFADDAQALAWLEQHAGKPAALRQAVAGEWTIARGDPARNAPSSGSQPLLHRRWQVPMVPDRPPGAPDDDEERSPAQVLLDHRRTLLAQDVPLLPAAQPLALGNYILARTPKELLGIDATSGKRVWTDLPGETPRSDAALVDSLGRSAAGQSAADQSVMQRLWSDATYGTLASDGESVFYVQDLELNPALAGSPRIIRPNGRSVMAAVKTFNRLVCREVKQSEGKLRWEVGGSDGVDEPKLAGYFFLGPPLPLQGRLYVLAERAQQIDLIVLSAQTGQLEWSQALANVEPNSLFLRRDAGLSPSFADGVLVCPTEAGAIVAVELSSRSLLWGYQYPVAVEQRASQRVMFGGANLRVRGFVPRTEVPSTPPDAWVDCVPVLSTGKVLVTPAESRELVCLNLLDGTAAWTRPRGKDLYLAGVHRGQALLVGRHQITACQLTNGAELWKLELPGGAMPSGRGFLSGDHYYLPLTSAEVAKIDVSIDPAHPLANRERLVARARSRSGTVPGNLICYRGEVLSQNVDSLESYSQLDVLERELQTTLKNQPDDARALLRAGEVRLDAGRLDDAVELFRRSFQLSGQDAALAGVREEARTWLASSLLAGLRGDFPKYRAAANELQALIEGPEQRTALLRALAAGQVRQGDAAAALAPILELADQAAEQQTLDRVDDSLSLRRERAARALLAELLTAAKPADRAAIDAAVAQRFAAARAVQDVDALVRSLRRFVETFAPHPLADDARVELAERLIGTGNLLEAELNLLDVAAAADEVQARAAQARLALLLVRSRRPEHALPYLRRLAGPWAGVVCLEGKTGGQLIADLPADSPARQALAPPADWPSGRVDSSERIVARGTVSFPTRRTLALRAPLDPLLARSSLVFDDATGDLLGRDPLGVEYFRANLGATGGTRRSRELVNFANPNIQFAQAARYSQAPAADAAGARGHLLVATVGTRVAAVDTLFRGDAGNAGSLWMQQQTDLAALQARGGKQLAPFWGPPSAVPTDAAGREVGTPLGPVTAAGVCVQRFRDLECVDLLTGQPRWRRENVAQGSELFGDDELLFVLPPGERAALVLRMLDGELVGEREVPPRELRMNTFGRRALAWRVEGERAVLALRDLWTGRDVWAEPFAANSKSTLLDDVEVGVLEPNRQFRLLRLADGRTLLKQAIPDAPLPANVRKEVAAIYLFAAGEQVLLLLDHGTKEGFSPPTPVSGSVLVGGNLFALARATGALAWAAPVPVPSHGLLLDQPRDVPLLVFASVTTQGTPGTQRIAGRLLAIDKRTGRKAYENDNHSSMNYTSTLEVRGNRADHTVVLASNSKEITLRLSDQPWPKEGEQSKIDVNKAIESGIRAIFKPLAPREIDLDEDPFGEDAPPPPRR